MRPIPPACLLALCAVALGGCALAPPPPMAPATTKYTVANTEAFELVAPLTEASVGCTGLQERVLRDGRLQVMADIKNREDRPVRLAVQCAFWDPQGAPAGGEDSWVELNLPAGGTGAVRFTAKLPAARRYTVRVRQM